MKDPDYGLKIHFTDVKRWNMSRGLYVRERLFKRFCIAKTTSSTPAERPTCCDLQFVNTAMSLLITDLEGGSEMWLAGGKEMVGG